MATKTITEFADNLDGSTTDIGAVQFSLLGTAYIIDLSKGNQGKLKRAPEQFLRTARKANPTSTSRWGSRSKVASTSGYDAKAVRVWPASHGVTVPALRRIPSAVLEQYQAAGN